MTDPIAQRKTEHLDLATHGAVGFENKSALFDEVELVHDALPELAWDEIDTSVIVLGKRLRVPLIIAAMTGGTERAQHINQQLSAVAEEFGCGFGLGSQRPMLRDPVQISGFAMRNWAPSALVLGNIGAVQAAQMSTGELRNMVQSVGADALCVHLNVAMELVQAEGDRDFRGVLALFERLVAGLGVPVVAKETGCGLSTRVAERLRSVGVTHVDVSGAGGTSWVAVEQARASGDRRALGERFREWGIPTAASVAACSAVGFETIVATGGVYHGLDVARALALGASAAGVARPILQALDVGGGEGARRFLVTLERELRTAMLLVGARRPIELAAVPRVLGSRLQRWMEGMAR